MRRSNPWRWAILTLSLAPVLSGPARAQVIWNMPNVVVEKPKFDSSTVKARTDVWPRLDPGSFLCKTEDDLLRLAASRRGEQVVRPNCQRIGAPTPISIEKRAGPGRTQVSITEQAGVNGWTDAWLPERAPAPTGRGVSIK